MCRYIALNPVRANLCPAPEQWPWSSYAALVGTHEPPRFLSLAFTHALFDGSAGCKQFVTAGR